MTTRKILTNDYLPKTRKILTNGYVPSRPIYHNEFDRGDLDMHLKQVDYNKILSDPDEYFSKVEFINFDLIHHQCRGDKLQNSKKYYETIYQKKVNQNLLTESDKHIFVSSAQRCERDNVQIENCLQFENIKRISSIKDRLKEKNIFLSSMQKRKHCTDDCKSLSF